MVAAAGAAGKDSKVWLLVAGALPEEEETPRDCLRRMGLLVDGVRRWWMAEGTFLLEVRPEAAAGIERLASARGLEVRRVTEGAPAATADRIRRIHDYVERFRRLIRLERDAEMEQHRAEMARLSGPRREALGRAVLGLKGSDAGVRFHFRLVKFGRSAPIDTEMTSGDMVLVSRGDPLKSDLYGTVMQVTERSLTVAFDQPPPPWVFKRGLRLDLYVSDVTFRRMEANLERLRNGGGRIARWRELLVLGVEGGGRAGARLLVRVEYHDGGLNHIQRSAVESCIAAPDFHLIHGPPGTGKTRTLTELIIQLVREGKRVVACADSNIAVDNMLDRLARSGGLKLVRIGHPARVLGHLERYSVFSLFDEHPEGARVKEEWKRISELRRTADERHLRPAPAFRRGMSDEQIMRMAARGSSFRGVPASRIREMARWLEIDAEVKRRVERVRELESRVYSEIIGGADVVLSTNSMLASDLMDGFRFDAAVIDEGSQQMEPSTLIPVLKADRFFMAGDHRQLPPTIVSREAWAELSRTLFERLMDERPSLSSMLQVQYRMHRDIMEFPSREFYDSSLSAHESVADHTLGDLLPRAASPAGADGGRAVHALVSVLPEAVREALLAPRPVVCFVDYGGERPECGGWERLAEGSTSYENEREARLIASSAALLLGAGLAEEQLGVISPYARQAELIADSLKSLGFPGVEVRTVDGFQGREKEVVFISFVRSNREGEIGFLSDLRRLNVAVTRARRKLVCFGDSSTLRKNAVYAGFLAYVEGLQGMLELGRGTAPADWRRREKTDTMRW